MGAFEKDKEDAQATTPSVPTPPKRQPLLGQITVDPLATIIIISSIIGIGVGFGFGDNANSR
jgi:hypothetical protein